MNVLLLSFALLLTFLIGFCMMSLCWPVRHFSIALFGCKIFLAIGAGLGLSSLTTFFTLVLTGAPHLLGLLCFEITLFAVLLGILRYRKRPLLPLCETPQTPPASRRFSMVRYAFYAASIAAIALFIVRSLENPHGEPDAFYLWNACARFLFRSGEQWHSVFTANTWSHPDYPLLLPANVLRLWVFWGKETVISPIVIAFLSTAATVGVLVSALSITRGRLQAYIGGILLVSTPYFIKHGASQYADIPLGLYFLAVLILIVLQNTFPKQTVGTSILLGLHLGLSAWTKNEGMLFILVVLSLYVVMRGLCWKKKAFFRKELFPLLCGLLPPLLTIIYFKTVIAPPNDLLSGQNAQSTLEKLTDISRYIIIGKAFVRQFVEPYSLLYSTPVAILFLYALFVGIEWTQFKKPEVFSSLVIIVFMLLGYFGIYLTTPHDLSWHLATSLSRLWLQLWPSIIFAALLIVRRIG